MAVAEISKNETAEEALARIQSGVSENDGAAILAFWQAGVELTDITPRENVLTFKAWRAKGRQVAKGASGVPVVVWFPVKEKDKTRTEKDGSPKTRMMSRTVRLFHESQTIEAGAEKGTKPAAWRNEQLVKAGTYDEE